MTTSTEPQIQIEAPQELAAIRAQLESHGPNTLAGLLGSVGLSDPGPAIHVILATDASDWARDLSPWISGFALDNPEMIVIFPARAPRYPHDTLDDVLRHEVTHVLIHRAAGGRPVPRWFNEGLALQAEHGWRFQDQSQLLYQLLIGSGTNLETIDRLFAGDRNSQTRAYALAGAFVRDLSERYGAATPANILTRVRRGVPFDTAFTGATGKTVAGEEADFWERQRIWTMWFPIITSSTTLWLVVTLIALLAIQRRRRKNVEIEKKWEEEDKGRFDDS